MTDSNIKQMISFPNFQDHFFFTKFRNRFLKYFHVRQYSQRSNIRNNQKGYATF